MNELAHVARFSSMGEVACGIAHELNQPLTAILSYSQACLRLLQSGTKDSRELRSALERVVETAERAGEIVRCLRDFARKREPQRTSVDVNHLIEEALRLLRSEIRQGDIVLLVDLAEDLAPVQVDRIQIRQVLFNLLKNGIEAIKASCGAARVLSIKTWQTRKNALAIAIGDTGMGLAPAIAGRLFEPFVTTKADGMGLGLSLSRSIINAHGGRLWATPNRDQGTTFHVTLPGPGGVDIATA